MDLSGHPAPLRDAERDAWRRCLRRADRECGFGGAPDRRGDAQLRDQLARLLRADAADLVVTAGIRATVAPLLQDVECVAMECPTFTGVASKVGRRTRVVHLPWEELVVRQRSFDAVWVTTPLRNPDGRTASFRLIAALADMAVTGTRVVCNTAYGWFAPVPRPGAGVILIGSMHKLAGPGSRLGWAVTTSWPQRLRDALAASAPSPVWQRAWAHFLAHGHAESLRDRLVGQLSETGAAFRSVLHQHGVEVPGAVPHLLLPVHGDEEATVAALAAAGVRVSPGRAFGCPTPAVRVSLLGVAATDAERAGRVIHRFVRPGLPGLP